MKPLLTVCLALALAVASPGCGTARPARIGPLLPILPHPAAPALAQVSAAELALVSPETAARLLSRDAALQEHIGRYRDVVETYNTWAREQNRQHGYERSHLP
ncbi:hypothetical protein HS125_04765 [bacterium]|nr:hypothetical protein [bacterium]